MERFNEQHDEIVDLGSIVTETRGQPVSGEPDTIQLAFPRGISDD